MLITPPPASEVLNTEALAARAHRCAKTSGLASNKQSQRGYIGEDGVENRIAPKPVETGFLPQCGAFADPDTILYICPMGKVTHQCFQGHLWSIIRRQLLSTRLHLLAGYAIVAAIAFIVFKADSFQDN
eukprot:SAG31_NODE_600_length_13647_cov_3.894376_6_plen_129_part_00